MSNDPRLPLGQLPGQPSAQPLALRMTDISPGTVIDDYVVTGKIGEGGMGTVYGAEHPKLGKQVAIKVLRAELSANIDATTRFEQEALTLSKLGHPNIVDVSSLGTLPDGRAYFVMERLVGEDLGRAQQHAPLGLREICSVLNAVARALEAAHAKGIVHRDLKPENIFLHRVDAEAPVVKLLDFGIAKLSATDAPQRTRTGSMMGTPRYVSPEQARGVGVDYRTDIYSLGVVTFELVAHKTPFEGETGMDIMLGHLTQPPPRLASVAVVPAMLDDMVDRMLAKDASARPSLAEARAVFRAVEAGHDAPLATAGTTWPQRQVTGSRGELIRPPGATPGASGTPGAVGTPGMAPVIASRSAAMSGIDDTALPSASSVVPPVIVSPGYANTLAGPGVASAPAAASGRSPSAKAKSSKNMWASIAMTALAIAGGLIFFVNTQKDNESASPTARAVPRSPAPTRATGESRESLPQQGNPSEAAPRTTVEVATTPRTPDVVTAIPRTPDVVPTTPRTGPKPNPKISTSDSESASTRPSPSPPPVSDPEPMDPSPSAPPPPPPLPSTPSTGSIRGTHTKPNPPKVPRGGTISTAANDSLVGAGAGKSNETHPAPPVKDHADIPSLDIAQAKATPVPSSDKDRRDGPIKSSVETPPADVPVMFKLSIRVVGPKRGNVALRIRIDGKDVGEGSNLVTKLVSGWHLVELRQGNRVVSSQNVDLKRDQTISLSSQAKKN